MLQAFRPLVGRLRDPLDAALAVEVRRLEVVVARVSQALYAGGLLFSIGIALTQSPALGACMAFSCAAYLGWYVALARAYERQGGGPSLRLAATVIDSTVPWVFATGLLFTEGAEYALASWILPFLYCALLVGAVVRMRPVTALTFAASGGVLFPLFYFALARARLPADAGVVYGPPMQLMRALLLVLAGGLAALVTGGLRNVVGRAEGAVRAEDLFGKYRLLRKLASGGMGEVFEAVYCPEGGFERRVAVKRIHPHLAEQQKFVDAFRAEAELTAGLAHPNLVQVLDFGRIGKTYFLAMEYVDGLTLRALFDHSVSSKRPIPADLLGYVGHELLAGLAHAHENARGKDGRPLRVVHRDMCPSNVLLSRNGEVKVADFGVARALRDATSAHTRTVVGHVGYVAPELAGARPIDERADLFATAVILWELLAARHLFLQDTEEATLLSLMTREIVPISSIRTDLDTWWDSFFVRALARDPQRRFESAHEMATALDGLSGARVDGAARRLATLIETLRGSGVAAEASDVVEPPTLEDATRTS